MTEPSDSPQQPYPTDSPQQPSGGLRGVWGWYRRQKPFAQGCLGLVVAVFACTTCVGVPAAIGVGVGVAASNTAQTQARVTATATATAKPPATADTSAGASAYITFATADSMTVIDDMTKTGIDCGKADLQACHDDGQTFHGDIRAFEADLDANPAPPCLKSVDTNLRKGLNLLDQGVQDAVTGIGPSDGSLLSQAAMNFTDGATYIYQATSELKNAHC